VLVFPAGTDLHDHPLVESGVLMLQVRQRGRAAAAPYRCGAGLQSLHAPAHQVCVPRATHACPTHTPRARPAACRHMRWRRTPAGM
jgi:hypothetical protein